eukprot:TRINITY_DN21809_c0_g1_i1.p1 TRINITY_DN21809_c0_g1~~TRINITY_DN21809_c0_g1_i1.p1  ORF type:complete len:360 (+),score=159.31 TRINITY_DN21809_c0_g1_i1:99-1178(+)
MADAAPKSVEMSEVAGDEPAHTDIPLDDAPAKGTEGQSGRREEGGAAQEDSQELPPLPGHTYNVSLLYVVILSVHVGLMTLIGFVLGHPYTGMITAASIGFSVPWVLAVYWWKRDCVSNARVAELYGLAFELGHVLVLLQLIGNYYLTRLVSVLLEVTRDISVYLQWVTFLCFVVALAVLVSAVPDELFKFFMTWRIRKQADFSSRYGCIVLAVATTMGFAACTVQLDLILSYWRIYTLPGALWQWLLERLVPAMWMHLLTGLWLGIGFSKRYFRREGKQPWGYGRLLLMPLLIHCIYELFFYTGIVLVAMDELDSLSWITLTVAALIVLVFASLWTARNVFKTLQDAQNYQSMSPNFV